MYYFIYKYEMHTRITMYIMFHLKPCSKLKTNYLFKVLFSVKPILRIKLFNTFYLNKMRCCLSTFLRMFD